ncbi:MAG: RecX family transcriptional regulator [Tannerella sp.]|jgi:regulatory protein|nr:RecX family transcriptional regulator [Tannerella sp.]
MKSESEMLNTLAKYCSQAERCLYDVRKKISAENLSEDVEKRIINRLLQEKFIDEGRFSRSFVNDKFKFNHWGRIKIIYELKKRNIKPEVYYDAIETIDEDEYVSVLTDLLKNKKRTTKGRSPQDVFQKLYRFASSRGFESPLIISVLNGFLKNIDND